MKTKRPIPTDAEKQVIACLVAGIEAATIALSHASDRAVEVRRIVGPSVLAALEEAAKAVERANVALSWRAAR